MKTAKLIRPLPPVHTMRPYTGVGRYFSGGALREAGPAPVTIKVNHYLTMTNRMNLNLMVYTGGIPLLWNERNYYGGRVISHIANEAINLALKREIDRELSFMERGEDIGNNQRRKVMISQYLATKPARIIRGFYGVPMKNSWPGQRGQSQAQAGVYTDIVTEKNYYHPTVSNSYSSTQVVKSRPETTGITKTDVYKLTDQVIGKVNRQLRIERMRGAL